MTLLGNGDGILISQRRLVKGVIVTGGPQGATGAAGNFVNRFEGTWDSGTSYLTGDIVAYLGSTWLAIDPSTNVTPVEGADWTLIAGAGTNGSNGQGVPTGGSTNQVLAKTSGTDFATAWVSPSTGGVLTSVSYTTTNKSSTSTTLADIDATNLAVTFTAPASGKVIVRLTGLHGHFGTNGKDIWGLRQNTTTIAEGAVRASGTWPGNFVVSAAFPVTGLTPGNSYTYKWAWRTAAGTITLDVQYGGGHENPPAVMEVLAA
jgi:hypothetical protein